MLLNRFSSFKSTKETMNVCFFFRYEILCLAFETLRNVDTEQQTIDTLEVAMWKSCILAGPENIHLDDGPYLFNKLKTELLSGLNKMKLRCTLNDPYEKDAAESLINKLIDSRKLDVALRISTIFNYKHKVNSIEFSWMNIQVNKALNDIFLYVGLANFNAMFELGRR